MSTFSHVEIGCASLSLALGALHVGGPLSRDEHTLALLARDLHVTDATLTEIRQAILAGEDPFADILSKARDSSQRRRRGAFYTSRSISDAMVDWLLRQQVERVVDAGSGTGRFATSVARADPSMNVVAIDTDPVASLACRAALNVVGARRASVQNRDYCRLRLPEFRGRTGYIGNPPYVRQREIPHWSRIWSGVAAKHFGHSAAGAGLHVHFFLATALRANPGDMGCFLTSAEWLDTRYGSIVRDLLSHRLGIRSLDLFDPRTEIFPAVLSTAVITCFEVGSVNENVRVRHLHKPTIDHPGCGSPMPITSLQSASRWSPLVRPIRNGTTDTAPEVRFGDIVHIHRGVATGANAFFVMSTDTARRRGLSRWTLPVLNRGAAVKSDQPVVRAGEGTQVLLVVPPNVHRSLHPELDSYLKLGELGNGSAPAISERYLLRTRNPWWSVRPGQIPPIVATYMSRNTPRFAVNQDGLIPLNIVLGVFPPVDLDDRELLALVNLLNSLSDSFRGGGRTYFGGLEKFEPSDMLALPISVPDQLHHLITMLREARIAELTSRTSPSR